MSFPVPQLGDLEFEQLAEQARALIPRYAPEWTDHNLHDPGITILELLAWIVDQQVYQIGFVSNQHLQAFAALLGVKAQAAQPARGLIWPKKRTGSLNQHVVLSARNLSRGAQVSAIQQSELTFVIDADVHLTAAQPLLSRAQTLNTTQAIDLSSFFQQASASFEFHSGNDNNHSSEILEIGFNQPLVSSGDYPIALGIEVDPVPAAQASSPTPWGPLFIEYQTDSSPWQAVSIVEDRTYSLARTGVVLINIPANNSAQRSALRLRFDRGYYPVPLRIVRVEINVLPIVQMERVPAQVIGRGNNMPDQSFSLDLNGLPEINRNAMNQSATALPAAFQIQLSNNGRFESWTESQDLTLNTPTDKVYQLDKLQGQIIFGNGINGAIPTLDAQIRHLDYHRTQGAQGNLSLGFEWRVANTVLQGSVFGSNPQPLFGGEDAWGLQQLMAQTRQRVLERQVMLSNEDLLNAVQTLDGFAVARSDVLVRYNPALPNLELPGTRTVVVSPWRDLKTEPEDSVLDPVAERYLQEVATAIEPYRLLGERLTVITHQRVPIRIKTTLLIKPEDDVEPVKLAAIKLLKARFSDIAIAGSGYKPWPLGRPVTQGEVKGILAAIPHVVAVQECLLARDDEAFRDQDMLVLMRDEVAIAKDINISIAVLQPR